jgi:predicted DNA-binding transcriptional regulator AlpA
MQSNIATSTTFYRLPKVREICGGVSASTVWNWVKRSDETGFPKPIKLSENCTAWNASEIEVWAQDRVAASRAPQVKVGAK